MHPLAHLQLAALGCWLKNSVTIYEIRIQLATDNSQRTLLTNIIPNILEVKVLKGMNIAEKFYDARE
jgi:hypothetical protein